MRQELSHYATIFQSDACFSLRMPTLAFHYFSMTLSTRKRYLIRFGYLPPLTAPRIMPMITRATAITAIFNLQHARDFAVAAAGTQNIAAASSFFITKHEQRSRQPSALARCRFGRRYTFRQRPAMMIRSPVKMPFTPAARASMLRRHAILAARQISIIYIRFIKAEERDADDAATVSARDDGITERTLFRPIIRAGAPHQA